MTRERLARIRALSLELAELTGAELRDRDTLAGPPPAPRKVTPIEKARADRIARRLRR